MTYDKFQSNTRRFGNLGRGNCNMSFLYEGKYPEPSQNSLEDEAANFILRRSSAMNLAKTAVLTATRNFTDLGPKHVKGSYSMSTQTGRGNLYANEQQAQTQATYDPKFECVERNTSIGNLSLDRNMTRDRIPPGRPDEYANLVETKPDYAGSIDPEKVGNAIPKLGHFSQKIVTPVF